MLNYQAGCKFPFVERKLEIEARMQEFANAGSIEVSVGPTKVLVDYQRSEENLQISKLENWASLSSPWEVVAVHYLKNSYKFRGYLKRQIVRDSELEMRFRAESYTNRCLWHPIGANSFLSPTASNLPSSTLLLYPVSLLNLGAETWCRVGTPCKIQMGPQRPFCGEYISEANVNFHHQLCKYFMSTAKRYIHLFH